MFDISSRQQLFIKIYLSFLNILLFRLEHYLNPFSSKKFFIVNNRFNLFKYQSLF